MTIDSTKRYRSEHAKEPHELVANRMVTGASTVGVGASLGAVATHYLGVPEVLHAHAVGLVIFGWNTVVFLVTFLWRRRFGG